MKKSVITSDFEKKHSVPVYEESLNQLKKQRRVYLFFISEMLLFTYKKREHAWMTKIWIQIS